MAVNKTLKSKNQQGFALIFVMVFVALILGIVGDIVYQSQISARSSVAEQDIIDAEITAQSGIEFARFLLGLNALAVQNQNNPVIPLPKNLYSLLNGQPIGSNGLGDVAALTGFDMGKIIAPEITTALKAIPGYFVLNISSENSKFNLNMLQSRNYQVAQKALLRVFSSPDSKRLLEIYGYTPQQLVDNLSVYIKILQTDNYLQSATQSFYDAIKAKYKPKHAVLESLQELRRIPGFNIDIIYNVFTPYFTIWPIGGPANSLNINSAPPELVSAMLTGTEANLQESSWDKFDDYRAKNTFAQNNMNTWIQENMSQTATDNEATDVMKNIIGYTDSVFKVESRGVVNAVERTLVVVFQQSSSGSAASTSPPGAQPPNPLGGAPGGMDGQNTSVDGQPSANTPGGAVPGQQPPQGNQASAGGGSAAKFQIIYTEWK